ncbi:EamA family transporter [Sedimentibacter saalensis]|uniref:EamA family transporter n=1 Tax=Sedimentibacter saalensis TaxID=130788 RepID=UPI002898861E|nr:EamA family transporter [Sedimentibacter saalensis]
MIYYIYLIIMTFLGSLASYYLKKASNSNELRNLITNRLLYIGGGLYFLSALINIYILRYLDYSVVLPLTSITYIWTIVIAHYKLNEKITKKKVIGTLIIIIGAICVAI